MRFVIGTLVNCCANFSRVDWLTERITDEIHTAEARAAAVRSRLGAAAVLLRNRGARRIWLFGSMTPDGHPHNNSDVDLVVEGLPAAGLIRTTLDLEQVLAAHVDLIRLEESSDSLRSRIHCEGVEVNVPG